MNAQQKTLELKSLIERALTPLIENDYLLLDLPYHGNLGDTLIWQGELDFLDSLPHKCKYHSGSYDNIELMDKYIGETTIIIFHGGGNFGDIWKGHNEFRNRVIARYPNQKAIVLPQSVYYRDKENLQKDAVFFAQHPNVTICARDKKSLELLRREFPNNPSLLVPDMAFAMDMTKYKRRQPSKEALFLRRIDCELNDAVDYGIVPKNADVMDWIFLNESKQYYRIHTIRKWFGRIDRLLGTHWQHRAVDMYWHHVLRPLNVKTAIDILDNYSSIYTTRMHAALFSVILGKTDITLFDNSYGKSSSLYDTWLTDVEELKLIREK